MFKKISVGYLIFGILISSGSYYYYFIKAKTSTTSTQAITYETVATGSIKETIDAVGSTELINEQSLRFNKLGTITQVNFKDGDKIKKGQIIAKLDDKDGQSSVKQAQINLDNAKLSLKQLYKATDESQILQAQNTISNGEKNLEIAKISLENLKTTQANSLKDLNDNIDNAKKELENLKTSLSSQQTDLETTKTQLNTNLSNTLSNKSNTISQIETSFLTEKTNISNIIEQIDLVLGYTTKNKNTNDSYEIYLGAKNTSLKTQAENYLGQSISAYNDLLIKINSYDNSGDSDKLKIILSSILDTYKILEKAANYTYQTIDNSISSSTFSDTTISSMKSSMYNNDTNTQTKITSVNNLINTLNTLTDIDSLTKSNDNTISSKQNSINSSILNITQKEQDLVSLENTYLTTQTKNQIDLNTQLQNISALEKSLEVSKQSLVELLEGPTVENVAKANNSIAQAQINLQNAKDALKDYELESPFDGIVRKIDYKVGDKLLSDSDKYVYIENPNLVQIPVSLDQVDIVKVEVGKKAIITFDAYPAIKVEGTISSIDYTPVKTSGVVSYTVYLVINDKTFDKKILSGMTADIEITSQQKDNILLLSTTAITTENDKYYVNLVKNGNTIKTEITTGLSSSGKTEIISGLNLGDQVSSADFTSTTSTTKSSSSSIFGISTNRRSSSSGTSSSNNNRPPDGF
ncbi:MAG: efflux RND transporter periplasmic adaptor subunit [Candidatus Gracilibacteria bacterium]|nr:efflux RND transporter periplasmic adaptor subunit [Candidatus Gracilibacteria bacterium]